MSTLSLRAEARAITRYVSNAVKSTADVIIIIIVPVIGTKIVKVKLIAKEDHATGLMVLRPWQSSDDGDNIMVSYNLNSPDASASYITSSSIPDIQERLRERSCAEAIAEAGF